MDWFSIFMIVIAVIVTLFLLIPILVGIIYRATTKMAPPTRLDGKTIIITGASAGIGKLAAYGLARMGARIIMACRNVKKAQPIADDIIKETGINNVRVMELDLSDLDSVRKFAAQINEKEPQIHVLLNNAGIILEGEKKTSPQGFELIMATNHYGCFLLTNLLIGKLKASAPSRVVTVSSGGYRLGDLEIDDLNYERRPFGSLKAYCQSKLCNILFANELSKRLEGTDVTSNSLHPGLVATNIFYNSGKGFNYCWGLFSNLTARVEALKNKATDMNLAKKLWEVSARDVKLTEDEAAAL